MRKLSMGVLRWKRDPRRVKNNRDITEDHPRRVAKMVSWTGLERLRAHWYLLRFDISDYHYASRRVMELRLGLPPSPPYRHQARTGPDAHPAPRP